MSAPSTAPAGSSARRNRTLAPTPEYMEAIGRTQAKYGRRWLDHVREEHADIVLGIGTKSVCAGLDDEQAKHNAVAAKYPHLYVRS